MLRESSDLARSHMALEIQLRTAMQVLSECRRYVRYVERDRSTRYGRFRIGTGRRRVKG